MKKLLIVLILALSLLVRVVNLSSSPAGINADEAAIGYNAWSLIETGKDEHGASWPLVFRSFDDYKPPIYFYLTIPSVAVLGLTPLAVRLPSAILGTLSVLLFFLISEFVFRPKKTTTTSSREYYLSFISTLIFSFSPWAIHFARGGWEVNAALFFILLGVWAFLKSIKNPNFLYLFTFSFALSLYAYHSARLISPLLALSLIVIYKKGLFTIKNSKVLVASFLFGVLISLPIITQMLSKEGQSRFSGVSVFSDTGPLWQALELRREHPESLYNKLIHNQYLSYGLRFVENYLSHFSPRFLFVTGDTIARSKTPGIGQFVSILAPFYLLGLYFVFKKTNKSTKFILCWLFIAPIAAALTFQSPHALRSQNMVVPLSFVIAFGVGLLLKTTKAKLAYTAVFLVIFSYFTSVYLHRYFNVYPKELPYAWQYGFDQIANYVKENGSRYDKIIITDRLDQPYILMAFYLQYPPEKMQSELVMTPRDKFGFSTAKNLGNMEFKTINFGEDIKHTNTLIIAYDEAVDEKMIIDTILDPAGKIMYKIISTNAQK